MKTHLEDVFLNVNTSKIIKLDNCYHVSEFIRTGGNIFDVESPTEGEILCVITFKSGNRLSVHSCDVVFRSNTGEIGVINCDSAKALGII